MTVDKYGVFTGKQATSWHDPTTQPHPNWSERAVTAVATSIAVLIIAVVAVLMGAA